MVEGTRRTSSKLKGVGSDRGDGLAALLNREFAKSEGSAQSAVEEAVRALAQQALSHTQLVAGDTIKTIQEMIAQLDRKIEQQVAVIRSHPEFQIVERKWHGRFQALVASVASSEASTAHSQNIAGEVLEVAGPAHEGAPVNPDADAGWQQLLEKGLLYKTAHVHSADFKTTAEASHLSNVKEAIIYKRIREGRLIALQVPGTKEHRIPVWALDSNVFGTATHELLSRGKGADTWSVYHFLTTPNGRLMGLRPFELLVKPAKLTVSQRSARSVLANKYGESPGRSLLGTVLRAFEQELADYPQV